MKVTKVRNKSVKIRKRKRSQKLHKTDKLLSKIVKESKMKLSWITLWKNKFWKRVKSMLSNEAISNKKKVSVEKEKILFNHDDNAKILSSFFSNVIKFLGISQNDWEAFKEEIRDTTLF